ncbi:MAG: DUF63 family protein [Halobacteriaceae archaeon]
MSSPAGGEDPDDAGVPAGDGGDGLQLVGRLSLAQLWTGSVLALVVAVVGGSLLYPQRVYGGFVWHYFWGPVYADANGATCAVWAGGRERLIDGAAACAATAEPVAYPGYTVVSEVGYMVVLLLALVGVVLLLRRLQVGTERDMFYGLLPFMFLGGALRVIEDAADAARAAGVEPAITYPWNTLLISPIIYVTMFGLALVALVACVALERRGRVENYARPLFGVGTVALATTLASLLWLSAATTYVGFYPQVTVLTVLIATAGTAATWLAVERWAPSVNEATGYIGAVVIWGHGIDGAANVLILDWSRALGLSTTYVPKHPVNRAIVDATQAVLPSSVTAVTGAAWPFLLVKLLAATGAVWLFNDEIFEESPRYTVLLLVAVLAVGLGPGSRDMLRATFGI